MNDPSSYVHRFSYAGTRYHYHAREHVICRNTHIPSGSGPIDPAPARQISISSIWLNTTNTCNLSCRYCFDSSRHVNSDTPSHMSREVAQQAVIYFGKLWKPHHGPPRINFFGGEPLLTFDLLEYTVYFAKEWGRLSGVPFSFGVATNGTLLNRRIASFLESNQISVQVSLDGPESLQDRHRIYHSGDGSFKDTMRGVSLLRERPSLRFSIRATVADDMTELADIVRFFRMQGFRHANIALAAERTGKDAVVPGRELLSREEELDRLVLEVMLARKEGVVVLPFEEHLSSLRTGQRRAFLCGAGNAALSIDPQGNVFPCHRLHDEPGYLISHVTGMFDPAVSERFAALSTRTIPECSGCWASKFCCGQCPAECAALNRPLGHPGETWCRVKKQEAETSLKLAVALGFIFC